LGGWQDRDLVELCGREGRALATLDLGFANPLVFSPMDYTGIAVLRLPRRPTPAHLEEAIGTLEGALGDRPIEGRLWIVELGRIREYQPEREADDE